MSESFFKNVSILAMLTLVAAALGVVGFKGFAIWPAAAGILAGGIWMFLNIFFLFRLMRMGLREIPAKNDQILVLSVLKFPVLYLAGFFLLKSRVFPVWSLLTGLSIFMGSLGLNWAASNFNSKTAEKTAS